MKKPVTLQQAIVYFSDADRAFQYAVELRWPNGKVECPRCGSDKHSFISTRKIWSCKGCKKQFTVKVGTIFEDSPLGMDKWMAAFWMIVNCKNGVSSYEIHRALGVTQKSAWFMLHRIREAMKNHSILRMGQEGGPVEADETFIGGKRKNKHLQYRAVKWNEQEDNKIAVFGMLDRNTRQVRAKVIPDIRRETLQNEILDQVMHGSKVYTDHWGGYRGLKENFIHDTVTHIEEYVRGEVHTQGIENFWSLLKRSLHGTYVAVEPYHLESYVNEQMFRYNHRTTKKNPLTDADRFALAMGQVAGKRITYADLTGKNDAGD